MVCRVTKTISKVKKREHFGAKYKGKCLVCETACKMFPQNLFWNYSEAAKKIDIQPTRLEERTASTSSNVSNKSTLRHVSDS